MPVIFAGTTIAAASRRACAGRGFTLLEVLVALFVLAVGMLALAALQGRSLRDSTTAQLRGSALLLAYDISERMRANPTGVTANAYARSSTDAISAPSAPSPRCTITSASFASSTCTPAQMAAEDLYQWLKSLRGALPDPRATIMLDTGGTVWTITLYWNQDRVSSFSTTAYQSLTFRYQP